MFTATMNNMTQVSQKDIQQRGKEFSWKVEKLKKIICHYLFIRKLWPHIGILKALNLLIFVSS